VCRLLDAQDAKERKVMNTLREQVEAELGVAKAMHGDFVGGVHRDDFEVTAIRAYRMADAMLKAREA
jgi:hypothetical protein